MAMNLNAYSLAIVTNDAEYHKTMDALKLAVDVMAASGDQMHHVNHLMALSQSIQKAYERQRGKSKKKGRIPPSRRARKQARARTVAVHGDSEARRRARKPRRSAEAHKARHERQELRWAERCKQMGRPTKQQKSDLKQDEK